MPKAQLIDVTGQLHHETERAYKFSDDGDEEKAVWLPKSQCEVARDPAKQHIVTVTLPEWLAKDKGLI